VAEGRKDELLNPAKTQVELITDNKIRSLELLKGTKWETCLLPNGKENILLEVEKGSVPELNRTLVERGINVLSLRPKHSLEDFFLSLTAH
jgi:hypothetical protein